MDELNSPFNVCRRVDTEDLGIDKIETLARLALGREDVGAVGKAIFEGVGGQPHLVQTLLAIAADSDAGQEEAAVAAELQRLAIEGSPHIDSVFRTVIQDPALIQIGSAAASQGSVVNDPANVDYKFMVVLGLMRRDATHLVFRNPLYEQIARSSPQLRPDASRQSGLSSHFYALGEAAFGFIVDVEYREMCCAAYNGAVVTTNSQNFRLALVGFGVALEAMLLDWMTRQPPAEIATAVNNARTQSPVNFTQYEDQNDPSTWRLVNLMKVARQLNGVRGPLELPEALREMRNFVHPAVMKKSYLSEPHLRPETIAAGGLIGMVMRDIQTP